MTDALTPDTLVPAKQPTMYFIGVTTGSSAIHRVFDAWRPLLKLDDVALTGIDIPLDAPPQAYRDVVEFLRTDPRSRGALVTTHKLDVYASCRELLSSANDDAKRLHEVSALRAADDAIHGLALDTVTSALSLHAIVPDLAGREVLVLGAGGAALALCDYFAYRAGEQAPARVHVTDIDGARVRRLVDTVRAGDPAIGWEMHEVAPDADADRLLASLPDGSVVVNATGMGKDRTGSPVSDAARFPTKGYAWDFNYRGPLDFLRQATDRADTDQLVVEDGWRYFVHGWTRAIDAVFALDIPTSGPEFDRLYDAALSVR